MTDFLDTQDHRSAPTREQWFLEINQIGGTDPLSHFKDNSYGQVNLEKAHPGGLAQFVTGRPTLLSNLIRDSLSFSRAYSAANRIKHKQDSLAEQFGIESLYLASGLLDLRSDGHELRMPILLWPVNLLTKQDDFDLRMVFFELMQVRDANVITYFNVRYDHVQRLMIDVMNKVCD
jgi:hypothetical protein